MFGRTNAGGGATGKGFIPATYPEGSICTCSNDTRTLKAKDTSGYMMFTLPAIGKWTVTATDPADPTNTASKTVEITKEGESVSVELSYKLWLYKEGDQCVDVTGGWSLNGYSYSGVSLTEAKYNADCLFLDGVSAAAAATGTAKAIDLSKYNTLYLDAQMAGLDAIGNGAVLSLVSSKAISNTTTKLFYTIKSTGRQEHIIDISALSGECYIFLNTQTANNVDCSVFGICAE